MGGATCHSKLRLVHIRSHLILIWASCESLIGAKVTHCRVKKKKNQNNTTQWLPIEVAKQPLVLFLWLPASHEDGNHLVLRPNITFFLLLLWSETLFFVYFYKNTGPQRGSLTLSETRDYRLLIIICRCPDEGLGGKPAESLKASMENW